MSTREFLSLLWWVFKHPKRAIKSAQIERALWSIGANIGTSFIYVTHEKPAPRAGVNAKGGDA